MGCLFDAWQLSLLLSCREPALKALAGIISSVDLYHIELISPAELARQLLSGESTEVAVVACSEMSYVDSCFPADPSLPVFVWQNFGVCPSDSG